MQLEGLRILLAEDNPTNRLVVEQMLQSLGATVSLARDGAEALAMLAAEPDEAFDLLLVDIEMPNVSGLEVIRRLRAAGASPARLPVIALTAYATRDHRQKIDAAGANGVITKPIVSIEEFGAEIRSCLPRPPPDAPQVPVRTAPEIDRDTYGALAAAVGRESLGELLGKVDADISSAYDRIREGVAGGDTAEVRAATHIMMAVAGAIGATGLQTLSQRLNRAAHEGDADAVGRIGAEAEAEAVRVLGFVRRERRG